MRLLDYLSEEAKYFADVDNLINIIVPVIKGNSKLYNLPVIWRGWHAVGGSRLYYYAEISGSNDREFMRGMSIIQSELTIAKGFRDWVKDVVKGLEFTPICCTYRHDQAGFFGRPCIVIPESNFKVYQNPTVSDIATANPSRKFTGGIFVTTFNYDDSEVSKIVDGYKEDYADRGNEILLKCDKYYLVNVSQLVFTLKNSKFNKIKDAGTIKTYQQVIDLIYNFRSYLNFLKKRKEKWQM